MRADCSNLCTIYRDFRKEVKDKWWARRDKDILEKDTLKAV